MSAAAETLVESTWKRGLAPDPALTVDDWENRHRMLSSVASSEPGRWSTDRTPYLKEVMVCLSASSRSQAIAERGFDAALVDAEIAAAQSRKHQQLAAYGIGDPVACGSIVATGSEDVYAGG